ncbi:hypothetical protein [Chryseobacterium sp. EO14]|uniref:hypothetical protein n=1 Tax=Chryseobacterium sp. EO14 TaxID=2950551 RepID=UPI00210A4290|nr:hypothetical protein [Chryseobacterium sp. EO14]MCQ4142674.1 hypothetical protein [Chryseobacterium sp. EO14]
MKKAITFFTLLMGVIIYSQELKVKKEQILLDSNPIAKLEKNKGIYIFLNLDGTPIFTMKVVYSKLDEDIRDNYILLRDAINLDNKGIELNYDVSSAFANDEKIVVENSFNKYGFLTAKGIDIEKVNKMLNDANYKRELSENKLAIIEANKKVDNFKLFVNVNGEIFKGGEKGIKVGYLKGIVIPFYRVDDHIVNKNSIVTIYDNNNNKIGEFYAFNNQIKLTNGNSYKFDTISPITYRQVINRIIRLDNNFGN